VKTKTLMSAGLAALLGISAAAASGCGLRLVRKAELEQLRRERDEARQTAAMNGKAALEAVQAKIGNAAEAWEWFGKLGQCEAAAGKAAESWKRQYERCMAELKQLEDPGKH